jgi:hypothetical protein
MALAAATGVARTLRLPELVVAFDRRPPGLSRVLGALLANAGLLCSDDGWRAVVLPSLGDLVADLGPGPVAIRPDGRRLAVAREHGVEELDLPDGRVAAGHAGAPDALAYGWDGRLLTAAGGVLGAARPDGVEGPPVVALAAAARAPFALAQHGDGTCARWDLERGAPGPAWPAPLAGPLSIALSADGELAAVGTPLAASAAAALVRAADGALVRHVAGARAVALPPDGDGLLLAGDWGVAWLEPAEADG